MSPDRTAPTTLRLSVPQRSAAPDAPASDGFAALLGAADQAPRARAERHDGGRRGPGEHKPRPRDERPAADRERAPVDREVDKHAPAAGPRPLDMPAPAGREAAPAAATPVLTTPDPAAPATLAAGLAVAPVQPIAAPPAVAPAAAAPAPAAPALPLPVLPGSPLPSAPAGPAAEAAPPAGAAPVAAAPLPGASAPVVSAPPSVTEVAPDPIAPAVVPQPAGDPAVPADAAAAAQAPAAEPAAPAADQPADAPAADDGALPEPTTQQDAGTGGRPGSGAGDPGHRPATETKADAPVAAAPAPAQGSTPVAQAPAAPAAPAPHATAPLHQVPRAVAQLLHVAVDRGITHAKLNLRPVELGGIEIRLQTSSAGVTAQVVADSPEAAKLLEQAAGELRRALERHDVTLLSLDVSTAGDDRSAGSSGTSSDLFPGETARHHGLNGRGGGSESPDEQPVVETTVQLPDGLLVDVLA